MFVIGLARVVLKRSASRQARHAVCPPGGEGEGGRHGSRLTRAESWSGGASGNTAEANGKGNRAGHSETRPDAPLTGQGALGKSGRSEVDGDSLRRPSLSDGSGPLQFQGMALMAPQPPHIRGARPMDYSRLYWAIEGCRQSRTHFFLTATLRPTPG